ncbi:Pyridoxamine 5'-phosphate oxidase [Natronoarchaeum philippinense]|uniref:Pyridoxamine 5'-phosphate oxidase n=1 Tax=Natronoarchaeum philippinense TaxID=558529 RepID=A0A285NRY7_NATPI|nr:pyridoxamine 5'-phosphate oxidase family protein [Natronoarchaeum philippinense]SNZ12245.1 Pyridoxamine 5'-phosphate oxidase [Natronoarchaeum philippinense]
MSDRSEFTCTGVWSRERVESFLRETTVPLRLSCHTPAGRLWMLSLWYRYRDGRLWCATAADADVVEYLRADEEVAFEISTNDPPYRGVRGNGVAHVRSDGGKELLASLLERYLGGTESSLGDQLLDDNREEVRIEIEPRRAFSWDFSERMADAVDD